MTQADRFATLFSLLGGSRALQARFANLLSFMEYVGARKILKSQPQEDLDLALLGHASEELRHALLLKRLALALDAGVTSYAPAHLLGGHAGSRYMQSIDRAAQADLADASATPALQAFVNYLYTTLLVEERAREFYPRYAELLAPAGHAGVARSILREEEGHLAAVLHGLSERDPSLHARMERLRAAEASAFQDWLGAVEANAAQLASAAA